MKVTAVQLSDLTVASPAQVAPSNDILQYQMSTDALCVLSSVMDKTNAVSSTAPVTSNDASTLTDTQLDLEVAGWISFLASMVDAGDQAGIALAKAKLTALKDQVKDTDVCKFQTMITTALSKADSKTSFDAWWVVTNPDKTDGPLTSINNFIKQYASSDPSKLHGPDSDDGTFNFCITMMVIQFAQKDTLSSFGESFFGYYDTPGIGSGFRQCDAAAREAAYFLQHCGLSADEQKQVCQALNYNPGSTTWTARFFNKLTTDISQQQTPDCLQFAAEAWDDYADGKHPL